MTPSTITTAPIMTATVADQEHAIDALTLAFSADPACRWAWPESRQYLASFPRFARAFAGQAFEQGTAYRVADYSGAALWLAPGVQPDEEAVMQVLQASVAEEILGDLLEVFEQMGSFHPSEPHWYLPLVGVDPARQGGGSGSELLRHALAACDRDGTPAYLESTNARNIPLYERHGFEVLGTIRVGDSPPISPMLRRAR